MASQATITAKTGPGLAVTAKILTNLTKFELVLGGKSILYTEANGEEGEFDINASTVLTCTLTAGGNATIVLS